MTSAHPRLDLDENLTAPLRFSVLAALDTDAEMDFGTLRDVLGANDSALSKALSHLENVGYIALRKGYVGTRPRTWMRTTPRGVAAFREHSAALQAIISMGLGG